MINLTVEDALLFYRQEHDKKIIDKARMDIVINHLSRFFKKKLLEDVGLDDCDDYANYREVSDSTIARELTILRAAAKHNAKRRRIKTIPVIETPSAQNPRGIWLFKDEWQDLRTAVDPDYLDAFDLLYLTGSRRRAIEELEWYQVDFTNRTINLNKHGQPMKKKRRPVVPMLGLACDILVNRWSQRDGDYVFPQPYNLYHPIRDAALYSGLINLKPRDGRPAGKFCPHILRATRAIHLLEAGKNVFDVAKLLGDTVETVERYYAVNVSSRGLAERLEN